MPNPKDLDPTLSPSAYFGAELRKYRKAAGLSQTALADRMGYSHALVSLIETGKRPLTDDFVRRCDEVLELEGTLGRLKTMIDNMSTQLPSWFREWVEIEQNAHTLRTWEPIVVPGLLQTPNYARAILSGRPKVSPAALDKDLATRLERQRMLNRDDPPMFWVVLDESVLSRLIGNSEVMVEQLDRLIEAAQHPSVTVQVLPGDAGCTIGLLGAFVIAQGPGMPDTVYLESALRGETVDEADDVRTIAMWYESIRARSVPVSGSLAMIKEKRNQWATTP